MDVRIPDHELLRLIGRGSYGEVWLARNALGTHRAVKVVHRDRFDSRRPYEREFSGLQRFEPISRSHDGLVDILQVGRNEASDFFYTVMELADAVGTEPETSVYRLDGGLLDVAGYQPRTLASDLESRGRVPVTECLPIFLNLASALGHLHRHGLVHRDIKPSNIIFVRGVAKLADIGLVADAAESGSYVGTEGFIPPEGPGTRQADIYSLGKVIYEVATGEDRTRFPSLPIEADEVADHADLLELNAVILKACSTDPRSRYQTAEELASDLALLQSGRSVKRLRQVEHRLGQARKVLVVALAVVAAALVGVGVFRRQANVERQLRDRAEQAERMSREQLWLARLNEARALRRSRETGARGLALQSLTEAARVKVDRELRSEAAACLAAPDLEEVPFDSPVSTPGHDLHWVPGLERYLASFPDGRVEVRDRTHRVLGTIPSPGRPLEGIFDVSPGGHWLFLTYAGGTDALLDLTRPDGGVPWSFEFVWEARGFSPDDRFLMLVETNHVARIIDPAARAEAGRVAVGARDFLFALGPGGKTVASADVDASREVVLRAVGKPEAAPIRVSLPSPPRDLVFLSDGRLLVMTMDNDLHVVGADGGRAGRPLAGHLGDVIDAREIPGSNWLLTRSWDGTMRWWDLRSGQTRVRGASDAASVLTGPDGLLGIADESTHTLRLMRMRVGTVMRELPHVPDDRRIGPETVSFSGDGRLLVSTAPDGGRFWRVADGVPVLHRPVVRGYLAFEPGSSRIREVDGAQGVNHFDLREREGRLELEPRSTTDEGRANYFRASTNGSRAWIDGLGGRVRVNVEDAAGRRVEIVAGIGDGPKELEGLGYLEISADGRWLYGSTRFLHRAWAWDAVTGKKVAQWDVRFGATGTFVPGRDEILLGDHDRYRLVALPEGRVLWTFERPKGGNISGRSSITSDALVAAVMLDRTRVVFLRMRDGEPLMALEPPQGEAAACVVFDPSARHLAIGNETQVVHLWDLVRLRGELERLGFGWDADLETVGR